jgi:hypothetical protein
VSAELILVVQRIVIAAAMALQGQTTPESSKPSGWTADDKEAQVKKPTG